MEVVLKWVVLFLAIVSLANSEIWAKTKVKRDPETLAAKELVELYKMLDKEIRLKQKKQLQKIKKNLKKSKLFSEYKNFAKIKHKLASNAMTTGYLEQCSSLVQNTQSKTIILLDPLFRHKLSRYCWKKFFKKFSGKNKTYIPFVTSGIQRLLKKDLVKVFGKFLSRLGKDSVELVTISEEIKNYYQKEQIRPSEHILPHLVMDVKFTSFIQKNGFLDKTSKKYFYIEFKSFVEEIRNNYLHSDYEEVQEIMREIVRFHEANRDYLSNKKAWKSLVLAGKRMVRLNKMNLALEFFKTSQEIIPGENKFESSFQRLFTLLLDNKIYEGMNYIKTQEMIEYFPQLGSKFQFWIARTFEFNKEYAKAKQLYLKIIDINPLSFYAILALDKLKQFQPDYNHELFIEDERPKDTFKGKFTLEAQKNLKRMAYFAKADYVLFISKMVNHILNESVKNFSKIKDDDYPAAKQHLFITLINTLSENSRHLEAFKLISQLVDRDAINLDYRVLKILFPKKFLKEIKTRGPSFDPLIVLGLIRQESAFDPKAKSRVGARGLMQIMPATARRYQKLKSRNKLYDVKLNLKIGIKYLEKLLKENEGNLIWALAAYNAGEGNLRRWKKSILKSNDPITNIELIPFKETRNYVKLVYRNLYFYNLLKGNKKFLEKSVETNFKVSFQSAPTK